MRNYWVYILSNDRGMLYIGVTNDLERRVAEHRAGAASYTARHGIHRLVYFEHTNQVMDAIEREKQLKVWKRSRKIALIESANPTWRDLLPAQDT